MLAYNIEAQKVQIETFDGPLELLLYLVRKEGIDILEVPIARITDAYLLHMHTLDLLNINSAGDFLLMASTLCYLKCQELLSSPEDAPIEYTEEDDPLAIRARLRYQLINYQRCKEASVKLGEQNRLGRDIFTRPQAEQSVAIAPPAINIDAFGLLKIFHALLNKNTEKNPAHEVLRARYSIRDMSLWILNYLKEGTCTLNDLLLKQDSLPDRIVCFLSVLDLAKLNHLTFDQQEHLKSFYLTPCFSDRTPELPLYDSETEQYESF